jgi:hypothetical protein
VASILLFILAECLTLRPVGCNEMFGCVTPPADSSFYLRSALLAYEHKGFRAAMPRHSLSRVPNDLEFRFATNPGEQLIYLLHHAILQQVLCAGSALQYRQILQDNDSRTTEFERKIRIRCVQL